MLLWVEEAGGGGGRGVTPGPIGGHLGVRPQG